MQPVPEEPFAPQEGTSLPDLRGLDSVAATPKKSKKPLLLFGIGILAVLLLGGGAFAAYQFILVKPPAVVMREAFERFAKLESFSYQGDFSVSVSQNQKTGAILPEGIWLSAVPKAQRMPVFASAQLLGSLVQYVPAQAPVEAGQPSAQDSELALNGGSFMVLGTFSGTQMQQNGVPQQASLDATLDVKIGLNEAGLGDQAFSARLEVRSISPTRSYMRISNLSLPPVLEAAFLSEPETQGLIDAFVNKWIVLDQEELQALGGEASSFSTGSFQLTEAEQEQLFDLAIEALILEKKKGEDVGGVPAHHYRITLAEDPAHALLIYVVQLFSGKLGATELNETRNDPEFQRVFSKIIQGLEADVWVGKGDLLLRKIAFRFSGQSTESFGTEDEPVNFSFTFTDEFLGFNEPVSIEEPQGAVSFSEFFAGPMMQSRDLRRISDLNQLRTAIGLYFSETGSYPSTGGILERITEETKRNSALCKALVYEYPVSGGAVLADCPTDPLGPPAFYGYRSDGRTYELTAALEDPECDVGGVVRAGSLCLYRVTGP